MILVALQVVVAVLLIACILLQSQGSGLSTTFGGGGGEFYRSRRSMEKYLLFGTVVLSILFAVLSIVLLLPHK